MNEQKEIKALALNGGGVRGYLQLQLLREKYGEFFVPYKNYEYIAGCSVGGLIAGLFGIGLSVREAIKIFEENVNKIFSRTWTFPIFCDYKYKSSGIDEVLKNIFEDNMFYETKNRVKLLIPAYSTKRKRIKIFKNYSEQFMQIKHVLRATMSAPIYFEPYTFASQYFCDIGDWDTFLDGGVGGGISNNPSLILFVELLRFRSKKLNGEKLTIENIGTGRNVRSSNGELPETIIGLLKDGVIEPLMESSQEMVKQTMLAMN